MKKILQILLLVSLTLPLQSEEGKRRSICLNMIVKDESHVIKRCLHSVKDLIDYWVIVDTGSSDGTQELIKELLKDIPGELHEKPWVNFGHNREEALQYAKGKGDYILLMDADEFLEVDLQFKRDSLKQDCYMVDVSDYTNRYKRVLFFNNHLDWSWHDAIHERLVVVPSVDTVYCIDGVTCFTKYDGFRSKDPEKFLKDAQILETELEKDPHNSRYIFYLAQTYFNANQHTLALKQYERRASMIDGWPAERSWSLYMVGILQEILEMPSHTLIESYTKAFQHDSTRAEPLYRLSEQFLKQNNQVVVYALMTLAITIPPPLDVMYSEHWMYEYGCSLLLANAAYALGKYEEVIQIYQQLLTRAIPESIEKQIKQGLIELNLKKSVK